MTKRVRRSCHDNKYHVSGRAYAHLVGSRRQVMSGTAFKTNGNLKKRDLMRNKHGRYVSRKKYRTAKKEMRLVRHGYTARKGKFGSVKMTAVQLQSAAPRSMGA